MRAQVAVSRAIVAVAEDGMRCSVVVLVTANMRRLHAAGLEMVGSRDTLRLEEVRLLDWRLYELGVRVLRGEIGGGGLLVVLQLVAGVGEGRERTRACSSTCCLVLLQLKSEVALVAETAGTGQRLVAGGAAASASDRSRGI